MWIGFTAVYFILMFGLWAMTPPVSLYMGAGCRYLLTDQDCADGINRENAKVGRPITKVSAADIATRRAALRDPHLELLLIPPLGILGICALFLRVRYRFWRSPEDRL